MKKLFSLLLVVVAIFAVTGCGKKEPVKVDLTADNLNDYIIIDTLLSNYEKESTMGLVTRYEYRGAADLKVTARLKKDVKVEDVVIKGKITTSGMTWALNTYDFTLQLDKDGRAEYESRITSGNYGLMAPEEPRLSSFYNYELKENEFFVNDKQVLITSLSGSVYDIIED